MKVRLTLLTLILALALLAAWQWSRENTLVRSVAEIASSLASANAQLARLTENASSTAANTASDIAELKKRGQLVAKSQDQELQSAVAMVAPAVVSIVESKEVPKLQVTYVNPFGSNPFFQNFGAQVPVYQQVGTTTENVSAGTGFIVRAKGYIITNKHVVSDDNATYTVLLASGVQKTGAVVWRAPSEDLAVMKIAGSGYPTVSFGNADTLKLGQSVFAIGNALGQYNNSVSVGVISGLNRTITAGDAQTGQTETLVGVLQTDAAINPGNSGGPLVDLSGRVVGVNVATAQGSQNIGFSLPITEVRKALAGLGI